MYKISEIVRVSNRDGITCDITGCHEEEATVVDIESKTAFCKRHVQELAEALMRSISRESNPTQPTNVNRT